MWGCPLLGQYWKNVHGALQDIFECDFPFEIKTIYLGSFPWEWRKDGAYLMSVLLVASKKLLTRRWLSQDIPSLSEWWDLVMDIYRMEEITAFVNQTQDKFKACWEKWIAYIQIQNPNLILQ